MDNKIKLWLRAVRPFAYTASVFPVLLGGVLSFQKDIFHPFTFLMTLIAAVCLHTFVNLINDHDDFNKQVDTEDSYGSSGVILEKLMSPKQIKNGAYTFLGIGIVLGLILVYQSGVTLFWMGLIGVIGGYAYTGKPFELKYKALGAPLVFFLFGPLLVAATYVVQTGSNELFPWLLATPFGLLTTCILHANDMRDISTDSIARIRTLSMNIGLAKAQVFYETLILLSYALVLIFAIMQYTPVWTILTVITLPIGLKNIKEGRLGLMDKSHLIPLDQLSAKLHMAFGVVFILTILIPTLF